MKIHNPNTLALAQSSVNTPTSIPMPLKPNCMVADNCSSPVKWVSIRPAH